MSTAPSNHSEDGPRLAEEFIEADALPRPFDPLAVFGRTGPVEVEVGCGNGRFLRRGAESRPENLFLGIERSLKYARKARCRMAKYRVANARVVRGDATRVLADVFPDDSVHALHVYFTDPWPKRRHAKRRLFQTDFLHTVRRVLRPGGMIHIKVDLLWYFAEILARFDRFPGLCVLENGVDTDLERDLYEVTGFEQKALRNKGAVYFLSVGKDPASGRAPTVDA